MDHSKWITLKVDRPKWTTLRVGPAADAAFVERLRENLADFVRNISRIQENLYQDVTCDASI